MLKKTVTVVALTAATFALIGIASLTTPLSGAASAQAASTSPSSTRQQAQAAYERLAADSTASAAWTGSAASCNAGADNPNYAKTLLGDINLVRQWAGLNGALSANQSQAPAVQARALVAEANTTASASGLTHDFPASWACTSVFAGLGIQPGSDGGFGPLVNNAPGWSSGDLEVAAQTTSSSNPVLDWMSDVNNVGGIEPSHRFILLFPSLTSVAVGATDHFVYADTTYGIPPSQASAAWPASGYFPIQFLPTGGTINPAAWSYQSTRYNLSHASVSMSIDGQALPATKASADNFPVQGLNDSVLYWQPEGIFFPTDSSEVDVTVTISGVEDFAGAPQADITYTVQLFNAQASASGSSAPASTCTGGNARMIVSGAKGNVRFSSGTLLTTSAPNGCDQFSISALNGQILLQGSSGQSATWGVASPGAYISFQADGNVVEYSSTGAPLVASGTRVGEAAGNYVALQTDGNVVIYPGNGSLGGISLLHS